MPQAPFEILGQVISPGQRITLDLPAAKLYTHEQVSIPMHIVHGKESGPRLFVTAAIHGDEINGVEIIRRLLRQKSLAKLKGTLITIPVVNVHGFIHHTRYLPDRRDLNRSFPGSEKGSFAARLANLIMTELVERCTHGIDLHTGAQHRTNLPQIRANLDNEETARLAKAFNVPVILDAKLRDGSLRQSASELNVPMLLYEAGEALRFDDISIRAGVKGVINVMRELHMIPSSKKVKKVPVKEPYVARTSFWVRAPDSGIFTSKLKLGTPVQMSQTIGTISDPFGANQVSVETPRDGIIIGKANLPLVNEGDALVHIARFANVGDVAEQVEDFHAEYMP